MCNEEKERGKREIQRWEDMRMRSPPPLYAHTLVQKEEDGCREGSKEVWISLHERGKWRRRDVTES